MSTWKETIIQRFDAAAGTYDHGADSQRRIALALCDHIRCESLPHGATVLEIGCGTGFLTESLLPALPDCHWLATDISPRMVEICAARLRSRVASRVMDGENPDTEERDFDLIVSSLAVQWFADLAAGLRRLHARLRPGGLLAVTTLGAGTFHEWRDACHTVGAEPATPPYPTAEALREILGPGARVSRQAWPLPCPDLQAFLAHLKTTGARTAAPGQPPLSPVTLRRILRAWEGRPFTATYDVLTVLWRKES